MSIITILKQADIFYELSNTHLELVASICEENHYGEGDMIFAENSPGDELYVIADGEVEIIIDPSLLGKTEKKEEIISTLRRGQSFGEVALVDEGNRSAGARSSDAETHLIVIPREKLMLLCDTYPQLGYRLMRNLAADLAMKMRSSGLLIREQLTWGRPE